MLEIFESIFLFSHNLISMRKLDVPFLFFIWENWSILVLAMFPRPKLSCSTEIPSILNFQQFSHQVVHPNLKSFQYPEQNLANYCIWPKILLEIFMFNIIILSSVLEVRKKRKQSAYYSFTISLMEVTQILKSW